MNLKDSTDGSKEFTTEDFEKVKGKLEPLIMEAYKWFDMQDKNKNKTKDGLILKNDINRILKCWNGCELSKASVSQKRENGKRLKITSFKITPPKG